MTEKTWTVYRHISPSGKVYIGITTKPIARRWNKGLGYKPCKLFWRAILKYGWDNIQHEVLFIGLSEGRAKLLEIDLIRHYKNLNISYNITDGGDGSLGYHPSKSTRHKIALASSGRTHTLSEEAKALIRSKRISRGNSKYQSLEFRDKISKAVEYKKVRVVQCTLSGTIINSFSSANEAQRSTGIDRGSILRCCKGKVKRAGNFIWKRYE